MIRMYVMDRSYKWGDYIYLIKFVYNNVYCASLKMSLFKYLYDRKCNTPVSWDNPVDRVVIGPKMLKDMEEQMIKIKQNLKTMWDRQNIYADKGRKFKEF
jgi:hypothetical protein